MSIALPLVVMLAGADPASSSKILVLPIQAVGADADVAKTLTSLLTVALSRRDNLEVLSVDDARALLDAQASKELLGGECSDTSCLSELAGAMGAELVAYGEVAQLESTLVVTLNVFDAKAARATGRDSFRTTSRASLPDLVEGSIAKLLPSATVTTAAVVDEGGGMRGPLLWSGVGALALGVTAVSAAALFDSQAVGVIRNPTTSSSDKDGALGARPLYLALLVGGAGVGVVGTGLVGTSFFVE